MPLPTAEAGMAEDASLDDFLDAGDDEETASADEREPAADSAVGDGPADVEPATTTYAWSGAGGACDACGEVVERRWGQDGRLVCPACKEW